MPRLFLDLRMLLTVVLTVSIFTACDREQASAPPAATEAPAVETQQMPAESTEPAAQTENIEAESTDKQQTKTEAETTPIESDSATQPAEQAASADTSSPVSTADNSSAHTESLALARKSGCLACHAIDKKVVGPPWKDVAKRYANNADARAQLIEKVSKGGKGNWSDVVGNVAMPPYYPRVSKENIEKLVDFVLSLAEQ